MDATDFSQITGILQDGGVDILFAGVRCAPAVGPLFSPTRYLRSSPVALLPTPPPSYRQHWHYYERYLPYQVATKTADTAAVSADGHTYTKPKYVTMIVSGAPGDVERNDACPGDPSLKDLVPTCTAQYGYGILTVHNASAVTWQFTAEPTPIGSGRRRPFLEPQAGYTDYLHLVK
jgi:hypothetical protein